MTTFRKELALPYFSLCESFCTNPTDVPAITAKIPCPAEYKSNNRIPHKMLPLLATMASKAIKTGVEQGDEKIPPRNPAINAPINPLFVFFAFIV